MAPCGWQVYPSGPRSHTARAHAWTPANAGLVRPHPAGLGDTVYRPAPVQSRRRPTRGGRLGVPIEHRQGVHTGDEHLQSLLRTPLPPTGPLHPVGGERVLCKVDHRNGGPVAVVVPARVARVGLRAQRAEPNDTPRGRPRGRQDGLAPVIGCPAYHERSQPGVPHGLPCLVAPRHTRVTRVGRRRERRHNPCGVQHAPHVSLPLQQGGDLHMHGLCVRDDGIGSKQEEGSAGCTRPSCGPKPLGPAPVRHQWS